MKNLTKTVVGTLAAGAMAVSTASPALAKDRDSGSDVGKVIAGALVIGGIAAVAAASSKNKRDNYRYGRDYRYGNDNRYGNRHRYGKKHRYGRGRGMSPDRAVRRCSKAAQRDASRYGHGRADVTEITRVKHKHGGFDIKGRLAVNSHYRGYDRGKFSCKIRYGRIADLKVSGISGRNYGRHYNRY
ncbi:MAG: hypothetical protein P8J20_07100 [Novosphingobium sp.]|nr:hypothetical protein [Novosphingobium sp.]